MTRRFEHDPVFDLNRCCPQCGHVVETENEHTDLCGVCVENIADANHITVTEAAIMADHEFYGNCEDCGRPTLSGHVQIIGGRVMCKDCLQKKYGRGAA